MRYKIWNYFQEKYQHEPLSKIELPIGVFRKFYSTTISTLEAISNVYEIKEVVWSCDSNKAIGYDGFNMMFVKEYGEQWERT